MAHKHGRWTSTDFPIETKEKTLGILSVLFLILLVFLGVFLEILIISCLHTKNLVTATTQITSFKVFKKLFQIVVSMTSPWKLKNLCGQKVKGNWMPLKKKQIWPWKILIGLTCSQISSFRILQHQNMTIHPSIFCMMVTVGNHEENNFGLKTHGCWKLLLMLL